MDPEFIILNYLYIKSLPSWVIQSGYLYKRSTIKKFYNEETEVFFTYTKSDYIYRGKKKLY